MEPGARVGDKRAWARRPAVATAAGVGYCMAEAEQCMEAARAGVLFSALSAVPCTRSCTWVPCVDAQAVRCATHHTIHACLTRCKRRRTERVGERSTTIVCALTGTHLRASEEVDEYGSRDRCSTYVKTTSAAGVVRTTNGKRTFVAVPRLTVISPNTNNERFCTIRRIVADYAMQGCAETNAGDRRAHALRQAAIDCLSRQVHSLWTVVARHMVAHAHAQIASYRIERHCAVLCSYVMTTGVAGPAVPVIHDNPIAQTPGEFVAHPFSTTALRPESTVAQHFAKVKAHAPTLMRMLSQLDRDEIQNHFSRVRTAMSEYASATDGA